jgi:hypothetical protein
MGAERLKFLLIAYLIFSSSMCRKAYNPPALAASNHFLAIDGVINIGQNGISTFVISRSLSLTDTIASLPELGAQVMIQGAGGDSYILIDTGANGTYVSNTLNLNPSQKYQLLITTSEARKYASDFVTPKISPPIDSVSWERVYDGSLGSDVVNLYVNTHDPTNNTRYYRWQYEESFQHNAVLISPWLVKDGLVYAPNNFSELKTICYSTVPSSNILLGTSITLSSDIISQALLEKIPKDDWRMDIEYSILVKQYPLDLDAYNYWLTVQKNSQSLGGLFDLQPSQIRGNFHGVSNAGDPVLGYVSASSIEEKRIFINNSADLPDWKSTPSFYCPATNIASNPSNPLIWDYPDTAYTMYFFSSGTPPSKNISTKQCLDCTRQGGTTVKPSFWP